MSASVIAGFCERCGGRQDLERPAPGARRLGLERVRAAFRYCVHCRQFVGRSCCWDPEAVACVRCAQHDESSGNGKAADAGLPGTAAVQPILDELRSAVTALAAVASELTGPTERGSLQMIDRRDWEEAWAATGWLLARADSSRDAVSRQLWDAPAVVADDDVNAFFLELLAEYDLLVPALERRLHRAGRHAASAERRQAARTVAVAIPEPPAPVEAPPSDAPLTDAPPAPSTQEAPPRVVRTRVRPRREPAQPPAPVMLATPEPPAYEPPTPEPLAVAPLALATIPPAPTARSRSRPPRWAFAAAAAFVVVAAGTWVAVAGPDPLSALVSTASPSVAPPDEGVLGGNPDPTATPTAPAASPSAAPAPVAMRVEFDRFRIGTLRPSPGAVATVAGAPEIVAFPSPFDRSLRLDGTGESALCVEAHGLGQFPAQVLVNLYLEADDSAGSISLTVSPENAPAVSLALPSSIVESLPVERWVTVTAVWDGMTSFDVWAEDSASGATLASAQVPASPNAAAAAGSVCIGRSATADSPGILVNILRVDQ